LREKFTQKKLLVLNLLSSPGSGKTSLLEQTLQAVGDRLRFAVIVGDLQTERDADRVRKHGVKAVQINTGRGCHLDANMVAGAVEQLDLDSLDALFIENVGTLVCPAAFDLGETAAVLLVSTTEGDDKPAKYPTAFLKADFLIVNKIDLAPYTNFSTERFKEDAARIKPNLKVIEVSCTTGAGLDQWIQWLEEQVKAKSK